MNYSHWIKNYTKQITNEKASPNTSSTTKKNHQRRISRHTRIVQGGKWSQLIAISKRNRGLFQEYDQIRVQGRDINVGEAVLINSGDNHEEDYVGIIKQIVSVMVPRTNKYICLCNVEWYMRKSEVIKTTQKVMNGPRNRKSLKPNFLNKCNIVTYCHGIWKKQIQGYDKLQKFCLCHQPLNPDRKYIQCDSCKEWYHFECVGIRQEKMGSGHYFCSICK